VAITVWQKFEHSLLGRLNEASRRSLVPIGGHPAFGRNPSLARDQIAPDPAVEAPVRYRAFHSSYSVQVDELTMMACRSPVAFGPPSIGVVAAKG
jgi:hypothetical protein